MSEPRCRSGFWGKIGERPIESSLRMATACLSKFHQNLTRLVSQPVVTVRSQGQKKPIEQCRCIEGSLVPLLDQHELAEQGSFDFTNSPICLDTEGGIELRVSPEN